MRATAILPFLVVMSAIGFLACANRGMKPPEPDGGTGVGGTVPTAGRGGGGTGGRGGGSAGTAAAGTSGQAGLGGNCFAETTDGGATGGSGGGCGAMFNFETDTQGAMITGGASMAFKSMTRSGAFTFCGGGAIAVTAMFSGTSGASTRGELLINLPGAGGSGIDLTGKTITVRIAADPGCSSDLSLSLVLNTTAGPYYFTPPFPLRPVTNMWKTQSATVTPDAGSMTALALSLQVFSQSGYQGTIYFDEIDIR